MHLVTLMLACLVAVGQVANAAIVSGQRDESQVPPHVGAVISPPPTATSVTWSRWGVSYQLRIEFPATSLLDDVNQVMRRNGWNTLKSDVFNQGLSTSHQVGWTNFIETRSGESHRVYEWMGEWSNESGDLIMIAFTYRIDSTEVDARPGDVLYVTARFLSADELKERGVETRRR